VIMNSCPIVHRYHNDIHGEEMHGVDVDTKSHGDISCMERRKRRRALD